MINESSFLPNAIAHNPTCAFEFAHLFPTSAAKTHRKHEFLFMEGDFCNDIVLINKGKVKIGYYDAEGNDNVLALRGQGDVLGQMALIGNQRHQTYAVAIEHGTKTSTLAIGQVRELTRLHPPFADEMNRHINIHIRELERRIEILLCKNIKTRVVEFLKDMADRHGRSRDGGIWISHSLTQSDIAAIIGSSRKTTSLTLNELEEEGFIAFDRTHIFIPKHEKSPFPIN